MRCTVKRQTSIFGLWVLTLYGACHTDTQPRKDLTLSPLGIDGVLLCAWLRDVDSVFQVVRDSSSEADGVTWPIKIAELDDSGVVEVQSSWTDPGRVWGISTTSRLVRTQLGMRVGMTLRELRESSESLVVELPEGALVVVSLPDSMAFSFDSAAQRRFYERYDFRSTPLITLIPDSARIVRMGTGRSCDAP
jgi:hypothetical protein